MATKNDSMPVTVSYEFDLGSAAPNHCKATAKYKSQEVVAYGASWEEAKANVLSRAGQIVSAGEPPPNETVDLNPQPPEPSQPPPEEGTTKSKK